MTRLAVALVVLACRREPDLPASEQVEDSSALTLPRPVPARGDHLPLNDDSRPACPPPEEVAARLLLRPLLAPLAEAADRCLAP